MCPNCCTLATPVHAPMYITQNPSMPNVRLHIGFLDSEAAAAHTHPVRMANIALNLHTTLNNITAIGFRR